MENWAREPNTSGALQFLTVPRSRTSTLFSCMKRNERERMKWEENIIMVFSKEKEGKE